MEKFYPENSWTERDLHDLVLNEQTYSNYSTLQHLFKEYTKDYSIPADEPLHILQELPIAVSDLWSSLGLELDYSYDTDIAIEQINQVLNYIEDTNDKSYWHSINILVKSLHILKAPDTTIDTSYTDPRLPFTVFINLPNKNIKYWLERTVENLIHETMHLQLTLLESKFKLYNNLTEKNYSPWKKSYRNSQGILHALYVFDNLYHFWEDIYKRSFSEFALDRLKDINMEKSLVNYDSIQHLYSFRGQQLLKKCLNY